MLQSIREKTQGWIAGTIITILILAFALWGIHSYFTSSGMNNTAAEVNGKEITTHQLNTAYERLRRQMQAQNGKQALDLTVNEPLLKQQALQTLVNVEVLQQAASNEKFFVTDNQVESYLETMPEFQVDGQFNLARFQQLLSSAMISPADFLSLIKTNLLIDQPKLGILFSAFALGDEVDETVQLVNEERDIAYIRVPFNKFAQSVATPIAAAIEAYYAQHAKQFMTPEQVAIDYIRLDLSEVAKQIQPQEAALKQYYQENASSYVKPMQWKLFEIALPTADNDAKQAQSFISDLQAGKSLNELSKTYHAHVQSKEWQTLVQMPVAYQANVAKLTKRGEVSAPIQRDKEFVILQVADIQDKVTLPFSDVAEKVRESYIHRKAEEKLSELKEQLADRTYEHPESLQDAATALNLPIQTTALFTREKGVDELTNNAAVRAVAFGNDVLTLNNNSDVVTLNPDTYVVLRIKKHIEPAKRPLAEASPEIAEVLKQDALKQAAHKFAQDLVVQLQSGSNVNQLLASHALTWLQLGYIGRYAEKLDPAILSTAFALPNPQLAQNKTTYGLATLADGFAIVAVDGIKPGEISNKKQELAFAEQVQNGQGLLEYELYKQHEIDVAKIKVY